MVNQDILISGGGVAGAALAYWLRRYGFRPTVVERAPAPRSGGQVVDIRGSAREVIERMGLAPQIKEASLRGRGMAFIDETGKHKASLPTDVFGPSGGPVAEMALRRTTLARILYETVRDDVEFVFDESISAITQDSDGEQIDFESGGARRFDLVIGADGVHSNVRNLTFGPDDLYVRDLDSFIALCTVPTDVDLDGWQLMYTVPGRYGRSGKTAALRPLAEPGMAMAGFFFRARGLEWDRRDVAEQKRIVMRHFNDMGWEVPGFLPEIADASDFYFDRVEQVHLDEWSRERTVLLGDAAYCASPMSGIGTSLALVGAYVLAGELFKANGDHHVAYAAYEQGMREFVDRAQRFAQGQGDGGLMPHCRAQMWVRNQSVRLVRFLPRHIGGRGLEKVADTVDLDDHTAVAPDFMMAS